MKSRFTPLNHELKTPESAVPVTQSAKLEPSNSTGATALFYIGLNICECSHASCFHVIEKSFIKNMKLCHAGACPCVRYVPRQVIYPYTEKTAVEFNRPMEGIPRVNEIPQETDDSIPLPPVELVSNKKSPYSL